MTPHTPRQPHYGSGTPILLARMMMIAIAAVSSMAVLLSSAQSADRGLFGGEQSGHFIFLDHNTTGDGLISALQVLSLMKRTEKPLSELAKTMTAVPQVLLNVKVTKKPNLDTVPELQRAIHECEQRFNGSGRVLVRYSGTEPLLRVMVEGEHDDQIREVANHLVDLVKTHLG